MSDVVRQSDTYHAIAHRLGSWVERFVIAAYAAIEKEYDCERKLKSAKSKGVQENGKRLIRKPKLVLKMRLRFTMILAIFIAVLSVNSTYLIMRVI